MNGPLKWHGGKHYLAPKIVALMPPRTEWCHYVEPYFGGGAVLLANDPEGISEVVNDLDVGLTNFWRVLQHPNLFENFRRACHATPFSEREYALAVKETSKLPWDQAHAFFVHCRQSMSGRMKCFSPITKRRTRAGMNEQASAWLSAVEGLPAVHARLKRVDILGPKPALEVIRQQDGDKTLFYLDPPYLDETRTSKDVYAHEMTDADHEALLTALNSIQGKFMLSGYHSKMYNEWALQSNFTCHEFDLPNNSAGGKEKRRMTECVWTNY